ncbi:MAG: hypothetical protein BGN85_02715 [Alphaproteobacteria bacterium 64-11]|nr:hypothetical protein [Alphaproteobacteria bacterium]OJU12440.1 MAG: hypothetical protein BGN85_02715 [Alphaproteobacteria bacterium 64-11]
MTFGTRAAIFAAGLVAAYAAGVPARADSLSPTLRSFGEAKAISAYELSATGVAGFSLQPEVTASFGNSAARLAGAAYGMPLPLGHPSFATSTALTSNLALDAGRGVDVARRFTSSDGTRSPFLSPVESPFLGLANGGRYAGVTFLPNAMLRVRLGTSLNSERLDQFAFDPYSAGTPMLGLLYDPSQTQSLLAGLSWDISGTSGIDMNAISASRSGVPLGIAQAASIAPKASTRAVSVSARLGLGSGWVTTASFSEGLSQLDLRGGAVSEAREQSYSFAITKHGLFGDDALGLSLSQPAPSMAGSFASLLGGGDLPPLVAGRTLAGRPETDFQLGYVTNFLDGAVALQTNAAYQMNVQGKNGASSVSLLSRAKIKF